MSVAMNEKRALKLRKAEVAFVRDLASDTVNHRIQRGRCAGSEIEGATEWGTPVNWQTGDFGEETQRGWRWRCTGCFTSATGSTIESISHASDCLAGRAVHFLKTGGVKL